MRITADTNLLLRVIAEDDSEQAELAESVIEKAEVIAVPPVVLCELAWTLRWHYSRTQAEIILAIEALLQIDTLVTDRLVVEAGLRVLKSGGDFADGIIAWQGKVLGGDVFVSFDREAVNLLASDGFSASDPKTAFS